MGRKRKHPLPSHLTPPPFPNQNDSSIEDSDDETSNPDEPRFGTLLNNELRREVNSNDAPKSHQLLSEYINEKIKPHMSPYDISKATWVPISSIILPGDLTGKIAIISHLKDPRRALVYLTKGDKNGKDIPLCFSWQFIRIVPKSLKSGPTFQYIAAPKMCISSKKGCWLVWREYLENSPFCILNTRKSINGKKIYNVCSNDIKRITYDYDKYVRGMEIPPPRAKINYSGFEQFSLSYPTADWKREVCPILQQKANKNKEVYYRNTYGTNYKKTESDTESDAGAGKKSTLMKLPVYVCGKGVKKRHIDLQYEEEEEEGRSMGETEEDEGDKFKYHKEVDINTALSVITKDSPEFLALFGNEL